MLKSWRTTLQRWLIRSDAEYDQYECHYQAKGLPARLFYLFCYLLPGLLAYGLINVRFVYEAGVRLTGLAGPVYQYVILIFITFGWHLLLPLAVLRGIDRLTFRQSLAFLSLTRFDWRGCTYLTVGVFIAFTLLSLPYMAYVQRPLYAWLDSIPLLAIPDYSIFKSAEALYGFPTFWLLLLLVGNFVGEEVYFRGYLQKKTAFLGPYNSWVNAVLFALYHFFQIPQTWPLALPGVILPLLMQWRKNLYVVVVFHALLNLVWSGLVGWLLD
jgi:membrane protease YdiL (CAAX protease family)